MNKSVVREGNVTKGDQVFIATSLSMCHFRALLTIWILTANQTLEWKKVIQNNNTQKTPRLWINCFHITQNEWCWFKWESIVRPYDPGQGFLNLGLAGLLSVMAESSCNNTGWFNYVCFSLLMWGLCGWQCCQSVWQEQTDFGQGQDISTTIGQTVKKISARVTSGGWFPVGRWTCETSSSLCCHHDQYTGPWQGI